MSETQKSEPQMCKNCLRFYGNPQYDWLCSKCYKTKFNPTTEPGVKSDASKPNKLPEETKAEPQVEKEIKQEDHSKCWNCNRKVGVLGFKCKCNYTFCKLHRLPEEHNCEFDFSKAAKEKLKADNPLIKASKMDKL